MKDELLPHELKISQLYQQQTAEQPSSELDAKVLSQAKAHLNNQPVSLNDESTTATPVEAELSSSQKLKSSLWRGKWRGKLSWAASLGLLCVLFYTQQPEVIPSREFNPQMVETVETNAPVELKEPVYEIQAARSNEPRLADRLELMQSDALSSSQRAKHITEKPQKPKMAKLVASQAVVTEKVLDSKPFAERSGQEVSISLLDMSKLAETIKLEMAISLNTQLPDNSKLIELRKTLFTHLVKYQQTHPQFEVSANYLAVLTEQQVQKLLSNKP